MKTSRVAVAGLVAMVACGGDEGRPTPTGPSPVAGGSAVSPCAAGAHEDGAPPNRRLKVCAPGAVSPQDGATVTGPELTLTITSPDWTFTRELPPAVDGETLHVKFELWVESQPPHAQRVRQSAATTSYTLPADLLENGADYRWRARAELGDAAGPWSATFRFTTAFPSPPEFAVGGSPDAPFTTSGGNPRVMIDVVRRVAARHPGALRRSCQEHGGSWEFMDRVVEELRKIDGRWGYNCKRGNCAHISLDVVDYYRGSGGDTAAANRSSDVAIIDIIAGHCGPDPRPAWIDQTRATSDAGAIGRWIYPRR